MTTTDDLIRRLAADLTPVSPGSAWRRLALGVGAGAIVSLIAMTVWLGPPFQAAGVDAAIRKLAFPAALCAIAFALLLRSGRPPRKLGRRWLWLLLPPAVVAIAAAMELSASTESWVEVWFGSTWQRCLAAIPLLSLPILAGAIWAFRSLAPTHLRSAGLLAGLAAGSVAAAVYALFCPETTRTFLLSWYSLGILAAGLIGAMFGPRLLRW